jgi:hypothetical protein
MLRSRKAIALSVALSLAIFVVIFMVVVPHKGGGSAADRGGSARVAEPKTTVEHYKFFVAGSGSEKGYFAMLTWTKHPDGSVDEGCYIKAIPATLGNQSEKTPPHLDTYPFTGVFRPEEAKIVFDRGSFGIDEQVVGTIIDEGKKLRLSINATVVQTPELEATNAETLPDVKGFATAYPEWSSDELRKQSSCRPDHSGTGAERSNGR